MLASAVIVRWIVSRNPNRNGLLGQALLQTTVLRLQLLRLQIAVLLKTGGRRT